MQGIVVQVTFKYLENQRDPFTKAFIEGKKTFTFIPTRNARYEFDLSAVLLALAFDRGLFPFSTIHALLDDDRVDVPTVASVSQQAVFVASDQAENIVVNKPMKEHALNSKLKQMCVSVGLLERNTMFLMACGHHRDSP